MPNPTDQDTRETNDSALALPDIAVAQWLSELAENTRQWGEYAQQKLIEGDQAKASKALVTMNAQIEELTRHAQLSQAVMSGLVEVVRTVESQRDELVREVETIKDKRAFDIDKAFENGMDAGKEDLFTEISDDPSIVEGAVDEAREHNLLYLVGQLRRVGKVKKAELLERRYEEVKESKDELTRLEDEARAEYYRLPIEARIDSPTLEGDDDLDDESFYEGDGSTEGDD